MRVTQDRSGARIAIAGSADFSFRTPYDVSVNFPRRDKPESRPSWSVSNVQVENYARVTVVVFRRNIFKNRRKNARAR